MIERPNVEALLAGPLGEWLERQVQVRAEAKAKSNKRFVIAGLIGAVLAFVGWTTLPIPEQIKAFGTLAIALVGAAWAYAPRAKAIEETKNGINKAIAASLGLSYEMEFDPGHGFDLARRYGLLPSYDRSNFEDLWSGPLGARAFTLHEAHLEEERGSGKNRSYVTVFRGAILTISFDRRFLGTTLVERSNKHRKLFGGSQDSVELDGLELDYVDMVHPDFQDRFSVWSDDQVEARYLVHPRYVERLLDIEQAFSGKDVRTLFKGGELVIVIESENMFESGSLDASEDRARVTRCVDQFMTLVDLCEALNEPAR
ncbi:DUF3137 domain-containing protein [Altererythrobacter sp. Root672]|uniref:DUF3137 domain-containing protein n=1 Tax=Altererythrobacter sp. Root672 TaxID=1736584 RepID=UPI0006FEF45E|nr:DUF3137 domain-containing protein [Altererythrobacter sp. Root672]KRA83588.1 hypothetical protein ASD76_06025 [Altererythrobacter sp. Root672]